MRQSTVIFGSILFAFIVYITMRGQLPAYIDLFKSGPSSRPSSSGGASSSSSASSDNPIGNAANSVARSVVDKAKGMLGGIF